MLYDGQSLIFLFADYILDQYSDTREVARYSLQKPWKQTFLMNLNVSYVAICCPRNSFLREAMWSPWKAWQMLSASLPRAKQVKTLEAMNKTSSQRL